MIDSKIHFFIGKGGVGKSTVSVLSALKLADLGESTMLISLDPAHNQKDIFEMDFSGQPVKPVNNLLVVEPDIDWWVKKYLDNAQKKLQSNYSYQQAFGMKNYFKLLKYSPAVEEYAMLMAFAYYLEKFKEIKHFIVDMPPTALSLRFFALPGISLKWLEQLIELRQAIQKKKEIISKLTIGKNEIETDKVMLQLNNLTKIYQNFQNIFTSPNTFINVVVNPENLSINEAERIQSKLEDINLDIDELILNKLLIDNDFKLKGKLNTLKIKNIYMSDNKLSGLNALVDFQKKMLK